MATKHGITLVEASDGIRTLVTVATAVIGMVVTAPDADANVFPLNRPILVTDVESAIGKAGVTVSKRMQIDPNGTILDVFERLSKLSPDRQASMLDNLFGSESIAAIAPLLTNLDGLRKRFDLVGNSGQYAGSMTAEFLSRINTTQGATDLAANALQSVNLALGQALLPTIKQGALRFGAMALRVRAFAMRHPELTRYVLLAAAGLSILFGIIGAGAIAMAAIMGPIAVMNAGLIGMGVSGGIASIGLMPILGIFAAIVAGGAAIAYVAYKIYENWDKITAFFSSIWASVKATFNGGIGSIAAALINFSPMGLLYAGFAALINWLGGSMASSLTEAGGNLMLGLGRGILDRLKFIKAVVISAASSVAKWFRNALGIRSPSRVFMGFGGYLTEGLAIGIQRGGDQPVNRLRRVVTDMRRVTTANALQTTAQGVMAAVSLGSAVAPAGAVTTPRSATSVGAAVAPRYEIHIHQQPGETEDALVARLEQMLDRRDRDRDARSRSSYRDRQDQDALD